MRDGQQRTVFLKPAAWNAAEALTGGNSDVPRRYYTGIRAAGQERVAILSEGVVLEVEPSSISACYGYCAEPE